MVGRWPLAASAVLMMVLAGVGPVPAGASDHEPLAVTGIEDQRLVQGGSLPTFLLGSGLLSATEVTVSGEGVTGVLGAGTDGRRAVTFTADADAAIGHRSVVLSDGVDDVTCYGCLRVRAATGGADAATLYTWGDNFAGQLGQGTNAPRLEPVTVLNASGISAAAAGLTHTLLLRDDGKVLWTGEPYVFEQGVLPTTVPEAIPGITGATQASSYWYSSLILLDDGTALAWGENGEGQLGVGDTQHRSALPDIEKIEGITDATQVAMGGDFAMALRVDGTVLAWGRNDVGQLGDATAPGRTVPGPVPGLGDVTAIAAGYSHALALQSDGTLLAWGWNQDGQVGEGTTANAATPVVVLDGVIAVAAAQHHSLAARADGSLWAWGSGMAMPIAGSSVPTEVPGVTGVASVAASDLHGAALRSDGDLYVWGDNAYGQLGLDHTDRASAPVLLDTLSDAASIAVSHYHTVAVLDEGDVRAWGLNNHGQIGDGGQPVVPDPAVAALPAEPADISAGSGAAMALLDSGDVYTWGFNADGQLGTGSRLPSDDPVKVTLPAPAVDVAMGDWHALALLDDGRVAAWGHNGLGQLGTGDGMDHTSPVIVPGLEDIVQVETGPMTAAAVSRDGRLWTWGLNWQGQIGDGTTAPRHTPYEVDLTSVVEVAVGVGHIVARRADGSVFAWGFNDQGMLGLGHEDPVTTPQPVTGLQAVVHVAAGAYHHFAIDDAGTVHGWGWKQAGRIGLTGGADVQSTPTAVASLGLGTTADGGLYFSLLLQQDGRVQAMGSNWDGELGRPPSMEGAAGPVGLPGPATAVAAGDRFSMAIVQGTFPQDPVCPTLDMSAIADLAAQRGERLVFTIPVTDGDQGYGALVTPPDGPVYVVGTDTDIEVWMDADAAVGSYDDVTVTLSPFDAACDLMEVWFDLQVTVGPCAGFPLLTEVPLQVGQALNLQVAVEPSGSYIEGTRATPIEGATDIATTYADGVFTLQWTPAEADVGLHRIELGVNTENLHCGTGTVVVALRVSSVPVGPVAPAPTIVACPDLLEAPEAFEVTVGERLAFKVQASSPDRMHYELHPILLPPGASFDRLVGTFVWAPTETDIGTHADLGVRMVTPKAGCDDEHRFAVTVAKAPAPIAPVASAATPGPGAQRPDTGLPVKERAPVAVQDGTTPYVGSAVQADQSGRAGDADTVGPDQAEATGSGARTMWLWIGVGAGLLLAGVVTVLLVRRE